MVHDRRALPVCAMNTNEGSLHVFYYRTLTSPLYRSATGPLRISQDLHTRTSMGPSRDFYGKKVPKRYVFGVMSNMFFHGL